MDKYTYCIKVNVLTTQIKVNSSKNSAKEQTSSLCGYIILDACRIGPRCEGEKIKPWSLEFGSWGQRVFLVLQSLIRARIMLEKTGEGKRHVFRIDCVQTATT